MNKYTSLKLNFLKEFPIDEFYLSCNSLRSASPRGNISVFTMNENLHYTKSSIALPTFQEYSVPSMPKTAMPSSRNFSELLNKLDLVTSPKQHSLNEQILSESDQVDCILEEGFYFYIKIPIKNKSNPLKVTLKKTTGKVIVYTSYLNQKPSASNYDNLFTADSFEIRSQELYFRYDFLYLAIRALTYAKVTSNCLFGKKNFVFDNRVKKKEADDEERMFKVRSVKNLQKRPLTRNFVEENLKRKVLSPEERMKKGEQWLARREKALEVKKKVLQEKREKAICFINKTKIRREQARIENLQREMENAKISQVKDWIWFLYVLKATQTINEMRMVKRREKTRNLTKRGKARTIQKFFRQTTKNLSIVQLSGMRAFCHAKFFYAHVYDYSILQTKSMLIQTIQKTGQNHKPEMSFTKFVKKIELIQQRFRKYLGIKSERLRKLIIFWDECRSFQNRRSIKKKIMIHDLNISIHQRSIVLNNYYSDCIRNYYTALRDPGIFISQPSDKKYGRRLKVAFHYIPSIQKMKQMIELASNIPDRVIEDSPLPNPGS